MTLEDISAKLSCTEYAQNNAFADGKITHIVASDLMSEVLVAEEENLLLITALNTEQTIRTAHIVDALGVLLVSGKKPQPGMIRLAAEFELSLIATKLPMFKSCAIVHDLLVEDND
jgi:hypothetical protein